MKNKTLSALNPIETLGFSSLVLLAVTLTAFFNGLMLRCFYRLRNQTFVKYSKFLVAMVTSDFVSTLLLIPSIVFWFSIPLPNYLFACVLKLYPVVVINYFRILSMFVFCLYRVFVVFAVTKSGVNQATCKFYVVPVTITLWITSLAAGAMPFILWGKDGLLTECRISFFSSVSRARYMAIIFDTPLLGMHIAFMSLLVWSRTYNKVAVVPNQSLQARPGISKISGGSQQHDVQSNGAERVKTKKLQAGARFNVLDSKVSLELSNIHTIDVDIKLHNRQQETYQTSDMTSTSSTDAYLNVKIEPRKVRFHSSLFTNMPTQDVKNGGISITKFPNQNAWTRYSRSGQSDVNNVDVNRRSNDVKSLVATEIRQFLVTIGIIIIIYDVTILPLLIDFHSAATGSYVLVPQYINSLWIVNVFTNPIVYLVRMERMRREMKEVLVNTLNCCLLKNARSTGHINSVHPA